jgi:hypothetical protein
VGERDDRNVEVRGSIPLCSTTSQGLSRFWLGPWHVLGRVSGLLIEYYPSPATITPGFRASAAGLGAARPGALRKQSAHFYGDERNGKVTDLTLTINLCTRGRPELLLRTVQETLPNMVLPTTIFMISVDHDDQKTIDALPQLPADRRLRPVIAQREDSLGGKYNRALQVPADVYLAMVDYGPHVTPGFDAKILEAASLFPDNIGVVYNHLANASFPQINGITHGLARKMGFIYPPYFPYWFIDHWLDDIARLIDRISFADVRIDTTRRPGTQELRELTFWANFYDLGQIARRRCAHDIIRSPEFLDPPWRKEMLMRHYPLVEGRSLYVNGVLRAESYQQYEKQMGAGAGNERYERLKAQATHLANVWLAEIHAIQAALQNAQMPELAEERIAIAS